MNKLWTLALIVGCCIAAVTPLQEREWRDKMRDALFVPNKLPALAAAFGWGGQLEQIKRGLLVGVILF